MTYTRLLLIVLIATVAFSEASYKPVFYPYGPQVDVPLNQLVGWKRCWMSLYNTTTDLLEDVFNNCGGSHLLYGCRNNTAESFTVLAVGSRDAMVNDTGYYTDTVLTDNGVAFYFNNETSIGFAKEGDTVYKNSCDTESENAEQRLCWHVSSYDENGIDVKVPSFDPGYRCGATEDLNYADDWIREIWMPADPCEGKAEGDTCDDYNPCTSATTCQSGVCRGGQPACGCMECDAILGCLTTPLANGTTCDDDNLCTESDTCQSGVCVGSSPKDCVSEQQCFNSTCVPTTGKCQLTAIDGCSPPQAATPVSLVTNSGASKSSLACTFIIALTALAYL